MPLLDAAISHFETVQRALRLSPPLRRAGGVAFLLLVGCFQYLALPQVAKSPFYLLALIPIAFLEPLPIATAFSVLAAAISSARRCSLILVALRWFSRIGRLWRD